MLPNVTNACPILNMKIYLRGYIFRKTNNVD